MVKKAKYGFELTGLNIMKIHVKYGIDISIENCVIEDDPESTTKLVDLHNKGATPEIVSFLDESKKVHSCYVSMIDFNSKMNVNLLRYHCFWCRNPFECRPIGCPIKYISPQVTKRYYSHISKDTYVIKENVTKVKQDMINDENISCNKGEYYETDGVFCSFNCCKAYIDDNKHNRLYDESMMLLTKMYNNIMNTKSIVITPAPHWRTLEHYGGHLNIIQFRDSFNKIDYDCHGNTRPVPIFQPIGTLFEEKIKF